VGANLNDAGGSDAGRAYVFHGGPGPHPIEIAASNAVLIITGAEANDQFGVAVSRISDLDGDELPDLVVGASSGGVTGKGKAGRAYFFSGQSGGPLGLNAFGEMWDDRFGISVNGEVDFNNDGATDLIVGAVWVRGDLASVSVYGTDTVGELVGADALIDHDLPDVGHGLYYLVRLGGSCEAASWQSSPNAEPDRDVMLP
jgi:hypothetical protein